MVTTVVGVGSGCSTVSQPDPNAWDESAEQSLKDASASLATTRTVVDELNDDHLPRRYAVTVLEAKETALGTAEESLATLQAPKGRERRADELLTLIGDAVDAHRAVRQYVVADQTVPDPALRELTTLIEELETEVKTFQ